MTGLFDGVVPFVHTARHLSFRKAADELGVTVAAVSKAVRRLERELGVVLLHRTTRRVALSDAGTMFLARCEEAMTHVRAGRELIADAQRVPRGELRVSLPFVLGRHVLRRMERFLARHPALQVDLRFSDRKVTLIDERIDVAVRVGPLDDSSLMSRRIGQTRWITVASPAYLARRPAPRTLAELREHGCIRFKSTRGKVVPWTFATARTLAVPGSLDLDQGDLILDAALAGIGIAQVFDLMVREHLAAGRLVEVLADEGAEGPSLFAVWLPSQRSSPKVRAFVELLVETFAERARTD